MARERVGKVPTADDDGYRLKRLADIIDAEGNPIGRKAAGLVTEDDLEHAIDVLRLRGHVASTINHYVPTLKSFERWGVRKGHLPKRWLSEDTSLRLRKSAQRSRRLVPDVLDTEGNVKVAGEERRLLSAANPWLQRLIIAALETGCRRGELLALRWTDVDLGKGELTVRAETTKTKSRRLLPVSPRLRAVLGIRSDPDGSEWPPGAFVFGNEVGERVDDPKTAWQICVLRAHGHEPSYRRAGANCLDDASRVKYRELDLHFHDLRHEAGSRLVEAGWPLHHVPVMLGHTNVKTTSTNLNITATGLAESMRRYGTLQVLANAPAVELRPDCKAEALSKQQPVVN